MLHRGHSLHHKVCLKKAPVTIGRSRIRFRADSGYYGSPIVRFLDAAGCGYVITAKQYSNIKRRATGCRFHRLRNGWQVGEFREQIHHKWQKKHRFVVVRRPIPEDAEEAKQLNSSKTGSTSTMSLSQTLR